MIRSEPTPINYRSVSEQRTATALLLKEGQWNPDSQSFLTRETQLQEVSRHFMTQHQLLRVSPGLLYSREGRNLDAVYPQCPKELLKNYHVEASKLGEADPNPTHIRDIAAVLQRRKAETQRKAQLQQQQQQQQQQPQGSGPSATPPPAVEENEGGGGENDTSSSSASGWGASAQDARATLEGDFLKCATTHFGVDPATGVAPHILSPSKYSRPSAFLSGSHSKRPARDRGYVANPVVENDGSQDDVDRRAGMHNATAAIVGSGGSQQGDDGRESPAFFLTDMTSTEDEQAAVLAQEQEDAQLRQSQRGFLGKGSGVPTLPPIGSSSTPRKQQQQHQQQQHQMTSPGSAAKQRQQQLALTPSKLQFQHQQEQQQLSRREPVYSSLLHELRSTRTEVEEEAKRCSTLQAIANLGGTPEFRRTVTRIFANPDEADRISDDEMRRRQKLYDRLQKQQREMDADAESMISASTMMTRAQLSPSTVPAKGGGGGGSANVGQDAVAAFERDMAGASQKM